MPNSVIVWCKIVIMSDPYHAYHNTKLRSSPFPVHRLRAVTNDTTLSDMYSIETGS